jgi:hypothetical protein
MTGLKCWFCDRGFSVSELKRRIDFRTIDGERVIFGAGMPGGSLEEAHGALEGILHNKCYYAWESREKLSAVKGDDDPPESPDWRDQEVIEVGKLVPGAGDGNHRGAGAQGP